MLVLSRKKNESIVINNDIVVTVVDEVGESASTVSSLLHAAVAGTSAARATRPTPRTRRERAAERRVERGGGAGVIVRRWYRPQGPAGSHDS